MQQYEISLPPFSRGFHVITETILNKIPNLPKTGLMHIFIQHTSAGLTVNEAADPSVLVDFESSFNILIPENQSNYIHTFEGSDDMPAHLKSSLVGSSIQIPITNYKLNLGTWQGVYLCEHRNKPNNRKLVLTLIS